MNVIPGMRFGALTTKWSWKNHNFRRIWKCTCECGGYCYVKEDALINGIVTDCGKCEENIATYEPQCLINAMGYEAGQILVLPFLLLSVLNTNLINPLLVKTFTYSQSITLAPNGGQEIRIPITVPDGYMFLCVTNVKSNGNVAYACYIASSSNVLTCFVGNDRNEQKIIPQGISADALFVKKWW